MLFPNLLGKLGSRRSPVAMESLQELQTYLSFTISPLVVPAVLLTVIVAVAIGYTAALTHAGNQASIDARATSRSSLSGLL